MKKRWAIVLFLLLISSALIAIQRVKSTLLTELVRRLIDRQAAAMGIDLAVKRLRLRLVPPGLTLDEVSLGIKGTAEGPILTAQRASIKLKPFQLFGGTIVIDQASLEQPIISVGIDGGEIRGAPGFLSKLIEGAKSRAPTFQQGVTIHQLRLKDTSFRLSLNNDDMIFSGQRLDLILSHERSRDELSIDCQRLLTEIQPGPVAIPLEELQFRGVIKGRGFFGGGKPQWAVSELSAQLGGGTISASGTGGFDVGAPGEVAFKLNGDMDQLGAILGIRELVGRLNIDGRVTQKNKQLILSTHLNMKDLRVQGRSIDAIQASAECTYDGCHVDRFDFAYGGGQLSGQADWVRRQQFVSIFMNWQQVTVSKALQAMRYPIPDLDGVTDGELVIAGPLGPTERLSGLVSAHVRRLSFNSQLIANDIQATTEIHLSRDRLSLGLMQLTADEDTTIRADGDIDLTHGVFDIRAHSPKIGYQRLRPFIGIGIAGNGSFSTALVGPIDDLRADFLADVEEISTNYFSLVQVSTTMEIHQRAITFESITSRSDENRFHGKGEITLHPGELASIEFDFDVTKGRAETLLASLPIGHGFWNRWTGDLLGTFHIAGRASDMHGLGFATASGIDADGVKLDTVRTAVILENQEIRFERGEVERGEGRATFSARIDAKRGLSGGFATSAPFDWTDVAYLTKVAPGLDARIRVSGSLSDSIDHPLLKATFVVDDQQYLSRKFAVSTIDLELKKDSMKLQGSIWNHATVQWTMDLVETKRFELVAAVNDLILDPWVYAYVKRAASLNATVSGNISIKREQDRLYGSADVRELAIEFSGSTLTLHEAAHIDFNGSRWSGGPVRLTGGETALTVGIDTAQAKPTVFVKGNVDIEQFNQIFGVFDRAQGMMETDARVRWGEAGVEWSGAMAGDGLLLQPYYLAQAVSDLDLALSFLGNHVRIERANGRSGGGVVRGKGALTFVGLVPETIDLDVDVDHVLVQNLVDDFPGIVSGHLRLFGPFSDLWLTGETVIEEARYTVEVDWRRRLLKTVRGSQTEIYEKGELKTVLHFDIGIRAADGIFLRNNLLDIELKADLRMVGTSTAFGMVGTMPIISGNAFFRDREYRIMSGQVDFNNQGAVEPRFDVKLETEVRTWLVRVNVKGTPDDYIFIFSSEPPLSQIDIRYLLWWGRTAEEIGADANGETPFGSALELAQGMVVGEAVKKQLSKWLGEVQVLPYSAGNEPIGFKIVTKKPVRPTISWGDYVFRPLVLFGLEVDLNEPNRKRKHQVDMTLSRNLSLSGVWDLDSPDAADDQTRVGELGLGLRMRFEIE